MSIVENRKAFHDYFIEERVEAGIALEGWEVKAIRGGRANLKEAYVVVKGGELMLIGAHISPLSTASTHVHPDPTRTRRLLMHRSEIRKIQSQLEQSGLTMVPLSLYFLRGKVKVELAVVKGRKSFDKRDKIDERRARKEIRGIMRGERPE